MPARLKLTIAYDGAPFAGWQSQTHGNTVQDHIEKAFRGITGTTIRVYGAGRTDAGVHALAQIAHIDLLDDTWSTARWLNAINAFLPSKIRVLRCRYISSNFHAQFSVRGKMYRYRIWLGPVLPPLEVGRAWHVRGPLDFPALVRAGESFVGTHDFAGFAANRGVPEKDTTRVVRAVRAKKTGALITVEISGGGFLYKMVRLMVGSMVRCGLGKIDNQDIRDRLKTMRVSGARLAAPAHGLFLVRVSY